MGTAQSSSGEHGVTVVRDKVSDNISHSDGKSWNILHMNICGFNSKRLSFESILKSFQPSDVPNVILLSETHLQSNAKVNLPGYMCFTRNRVDKAKGGLASCIKSDDSDSCLKRSEGKSNNEYIITRHNQFKTPINVINIYGQQENRNPAESIKDHWDEITEEVTKIEKNDDHVLIIGDLNRHIGDIVAGNNSKVTGGGKLLRHFLNTEDYVLLNASNKAKGGPFTRIDPSDPEDDEKKSCLDIAIVSEGLVQYFEELVIDRERTFTPAHSLNKNKLTYSDHYAMKIKFNKIPLKEDPVKRKPKVVLWNTNKKDGWKRYKELTEKSEKLDNIVKEMCSSDTAMNKIDRAWNKIKFQSFGKVSFRGKNNSSKRLENLYKEKQTCIQDKN